MLAHSWGCVFQILSAVSPVEGQERRICHYQLGSAKQLGWQGAVKLQEAENLTHELQWGARRKATDLRPTGEGVDPLTQYILAS